MSFSSEVKKEIFGFLGPRHCRIAELSAIIDACGDVHLENGRTIIKFKDENSLYQRKYRSLSLMDFEGDIGLILSACGKIDKEGYFLPSTGSIAVKSECCKKAYIRGVFLSSGTMTNPEKSYHMEFSAAPSHINEIFAFFGLYPKTHIRKSSQILYFKEAEQIATVLNIMGAHKSLILFENFRVGKDVNNAINRASNAAAANEDKKIAASAKHFADIMDIQNYAGLSSLKSGLAQVAYARLENPLASLDDIGKMLVPPISKSGVNHRLKKIAEIAASYRGEKNNCKI